LPTVLTIAGFDPSGGAGTAADLKTIAAMRCYGVAAVTAITVQNTQGVQTIHPLPERLISRQVEAIAADAEVRAVKVGMLATAAAVETVAALADELDLPNLVLDPVLRSGGGTELLAEDGIGPLRERLIPRAAVVTPNLEEAARLTGRAVRDISGMKEAARELHRMGARQVVVTGGHLPGRAVDVLFDGEEFALFDANRVPTPGAHGLGCAFSSALACGMARGFPLVQAIDDAKRFIARALASALRVGRGSVVLDHGAG
jgi:hydroxymethylpyrimidine/phosphomethylpyrimidine kinase